MNYTVKVTREEDAWIADIQGLQGGHTYARNLLALDANVREVIAMMEDLDGIQESSADLQYVYIDVPAVVVDAAMFGAERKRREAEMRAMQADLTGKVYGLLAAGYSVRDTSHLLGITAGRVSQLAPRKSA